jgi:outer membrane immunogenic protein
MRNLALAFTALAFTGPAFAADLPVPPVTKAPPPAPAYYAPTWTGCSFGANAGGIFGHTTFTRTGKANGMPLNNSFGSQSPASGAVGGQVGCDYQAGNWVFGAQGLMDATFLKGTNTAAAIPADTLRDKTPWFATATARVGYTVTPSVLLYGKGGAAFTQNQLAVFSGSTAGVPFETATSDRVGWTAGGGAEWMYTPNVSVFLEYQHLDFGSKSTTFASPAVADVIATKQHFDTVMTGLNFHFKPWP